MATRPRFRAVTDAHLTILTRAAQQPDGLLSPPDQMASGTFARAARQLLTRGLVEPAGKPHPANGAGDEVGAAVALRITAAGLAAIGIEPEPAPIVQPADVPSRPTRQRKRVARESRGSSPVSLPGPDTQMAPASVEQPATRRPGSKRARLVELLARKQGATLADLMAMTGWLPHTTRAALTGLRQGGYTIERSTGGDGTSVYRIVSAAPAASEAA